ncbi:MAG: cache domain-containing protein [Patescibacteria group bacterium]|jgi:cytochrome c
MKKANNKKGNALSCTVPNHIAYTVLGLLFVTVLGVVVVLQRSTGSITWVPPVQTTASEGEINQLTAFVDSAAELVKTQGENAFPELRKKDSKWWTGESYIFVYDLSGKTLVLPPTPEVERTNRWNTKDAEDVYYVREMINQLKNNDSGWLQYHYQKPGEVVPSPKLAYFKKVNMGGKNVLVGSGIYYK